MEALRCRAITSLLLLAPLCCNAAEPSDACDHEPVDSHVREQIRTYGPMSLKHEYFGFIYLLDGTIGSAVVRGNDCPNPWFCGINTSAAAALIPRGAKVLGEWHTHPRQGSGTLSAEDVRGAWNNRRIRCYAAYYARPNGEIFAWDPQQHSVPTAMASRVSIGNYLSGAAPPVSVAQPEASLM